jgi:tetratricopeptide (TPR) repeat protein
MKFQGDIAAIPVTDVAQNLGTNRKFGILVIQFLDQERQIAFSDGKIVSYKDNLGFSVVRWIEEKQILEPAEFKKVLKRYRKARKKSLGAILEEADGLSLDDYTRLVARLSKDALCESFTLREGKFTFYEDLNNPDAFNKELIDAGIAIPVDVVLMEAARRMDDWEAIRNSLPSENDIYRIFTTDKHAIFKDLEKDDVAEAVVRLLDGTRSIREVMAKIPAGRFETSRIIAHLVSRKLARPVDGTELVAQVGEQSSPETRERDLVRLKAALDREPANRLLLEKVSEICLQLERHDDAAVYQKLLAQQLMREGDRIGAEEELRRSLELNPRDISTWQKLYDLLDADADDKSVLVFGQEMAMELRGLGLNELARDQLLRMMMRFPDNLVIRLEHADTLYALGDRASAIEQLLDVSNGLLKQGKNDEAETILAKVIEYDHHHKRANEIFEKIRNGKLEQQRIRRRTLFRASIATAILILIGVFVGHDLFARHQFIIATREVLAEGLIEQGKYEEASRKLEEVRDRHPVSLLRFFEARELLEFLDQAARRKELRGRTKDE